MPLALGADGAGERRLPLQVVTLSVGGSKGVRRRALRVGGRVGGKELFLL